MIYTRISLSSPNRSSASDECICHTGQLCLWRIEHEWEVLHSGLCINGLPGPRLYVTSSVATCNLMTRVLREEIGNGALSSVCMWLVVQVKQVLSMSCHIMERSCQASLIGVVQEAGKRTETNSEEAMVPAANGVINQTSENKVILCFNLTLVTQNTCTSLPWDTLSSPALYTELV